MPAYIDMKKANLKELESINIDDYPEIIKRLVIKEISELTIWIASIK